MKPALDDLSSRYKEFLPKPDLALTVLNSKLTMSLEEYEKIYHSHDLVSLDRGRMVWNLTGLLECLIHFEKIHLGSGLVQYYLDLLLRALHVIWDENKRL